MTDVAFGSEINGHSRGATARAVQSYAAAIALVAASTLVGEWVGPYSGNALVVMAYLLAVLASAALWGIGRGVAATIASVLAYDFFFTEPVRTFRMDRLADIATVVVMLIAALAISQFAAVISKQSRIAGRLAARHATIAGFAGRLLSCSTEKEIAWATCAEFHRLFDCNAILVAGLPEPQIVAAIPKGARLTPSDVAAAALTINSGETSGRGTPRVQPAEWWFHPIRSVADVVAAVGLARDDGRPPIDEAELPLVVDLLEKVAIALMSHRRERGPIDTYHGDS